MVKRTFSLFLIFVALFLCFGACSKQDESAQAIDLIDGVPVQIVEPTRDTYCTLDGMSLTDYPGPKGQIHYLDGEVAFFCDTIEMVSTYLNPVQKKRIRAAFVQDMGQTSWENPVGSWVDVTKALYVIGNKKPDYFYQCERCKKKGFCTESVCPHGIGKKGAMGPTIATFLKQIDASKYIAEHESGGKIYKLSELTAEMVSYDGNISSR